MTEPTTEKKSELEECPFWRFSGTFAAFLITAAQMAEASPPRDDDHLHQHFGIAVIGSKGQCTGWRLCVMLC